MKQWIVLLSVCLLSSAALSDSLSFSYEFKKPKIQMENDVQSLTMNSLPVTMEPNKPELPFQPIRLLLPFGMEVEKITVHRSRSSAIKGISNLKMTPSHSALTARGPRHITQFSDYQVTELLPNSEASNYQKQFYKGFPLILFNVYPVFVRADKSVHWSPSLDIHIELKTAKNEPRIPAPPTEEFLSWIDNPQTARTYPFRKSTNNIDAYDYLIISLSELYEYQGENSLSTFADDIESLRGLKTKIVDLQQAIAHQQGLDRAQKLRNFIRDEYNKFDISYVLLVGDSGRSDSLFPVRHLYSEVRGYDGHSWRWIKEHIPADHYFACLDGVFNFDGDEFWGEPNDGANGQDVDFLCEVTVGRWPIDKVDQLQTIVKKTLTAYRATGREKKALMLGEKLFDRPPLWGQEYMNLLIGSTSDHGFTTHGYDDSWSVKKLYDKNYTWKGHEVKTLIGRENYLMINHIGHSNESMNMRIYTWGYQGMHNTLPYFFYTQGCHAGNFTYSDSIIEKMLYSDGSLFASVANTRYGLGPEDPDPSTTIAPGASQILHRHFINHVLKEDGLSYMAFAKAHEASKKEILVYIDHQEARWVQWAANYFGDPAFFQKWD
jgi:hypothetical protein